MRYCGFGKVEPGAQLREQRPRSFPGFGDFLRRRPFRHRDEDVSEPVLVIAATLFLHRCQVVVDVAGRHRDPIADEALLHPRHEQFVPDLLAKLREVVAVALHDLAKLGGGEVVSRREVVHRAVEFIVFDAQVVLLGELELNAIDDETLEHLAGEHIVGGNRRARLLQPAADHVHANEELALHDDVVVDNGDDAIEIDDLLGRSGEGKKEARERRDEGGEAERKRPGAAPERNHGSEGVLVPRDASQRGTGSRSAGPAESLEFEVQEHGIRVVAGAAAEMPARHRTKRQAAAIVLQSGKGLDVAPFADGVVHASDGSPAPPQGPREGEVHLLEFVLLARRICSEKAIRRVDHPTALGLIAQSGAQLAGSVLVGIPVQRRAQAEWLESVHGGFGDEVRDGVVIGSEAGQRDLAVAEVVDLADAGAGELRPPGLERAGGWSPRE